MEVWKSVSGYEWLYEVSDLGRVRSVDRIDTSGKQRRGRVLKPSGQYPSVRLSKGGSARTVSIHTMLLEAFVGSCPPGKEACHADDDPKHCTLNNLRWDTRKANRADMVRNGRWRSGDTRGEKNSNAMLTPSDVRAVRTMHERGVSPEKIANTIGTSRWNVRQILSGTNWSHLS